MEERSRIVESWPRWGKICCSTGQAHGVNGKVKNRIYAKRVARPQIRALRIGINEFLKIKIKTICSRPQTQDLRPKTIDKRWDSGGWILDTRRNEFLPEAPSRLKPSKRQPDSVKKSCRIFDFCCATT
jgi:hypothetical protein